VPLNTIVNYFLENLTIEKHYVGNKKRIVYWNNVI